MDDPPVIDYSPADRTTPRIYGLSCAVWALVAFACFSVEIALALVTVVPRSRSWDVVAVEVAFRVGLASLGLAAAVNAARLAVRRRA